MEGDNYQKILDRIAKASGLDKQEIERRVEAKRAKLSGLISYEGAAQVVAAELNINFDNVQFKIDELLPGMRKVNLVGKVIRLFPVREFTTKKGEASKVCNMILADETSNIKTVLWDTNHISLIEDGKVKEGSSVKIGSGSMRGGELHLGSFSEFEVSGEELGEVKTERVMKEKNVVDFVVGDSVKTRSFIVQAFEPRFFNVCIECKKKVVSGEEGFICQEHGKTTAERRALINVVIDDGSENIRAVVFNDHLPDLGITEFDDQEKLSYQREDLLGKEMFFSGSVRMNSYFNNPEFIIDGIEAMNVETLLQSLEA